MIEKFIMIIKILEFIYLILRFLSLNLLKKIASCQWLIILIVIKLILIYYIIKFFKIKVVFIILN